jgi:hypothetical protein
MQELRLIKKPEKKRNPMAKDRCSLSVPVENHDQNHVLPPLAELVDARGAHIPPQSKNHDWKSEDEPSPASPCREKKPGDNIGCEKPADEKAAIANPSRRNSEHDAGRPLMR